MAKRARAPVVPDRERAKATLEDMWRTVLETESANDWTEITEPVNSPQTAIRFCLPTQLLGKLVNPELDAMCLQKGDGTGGRWDPRGFASSIIVPWNRSNQSVLGPSGDPYVSNPLRRPRVDSGLDQMGDREPWEKLCGISGKIETAGNSAYTMHVFLEVLRVIHDGLRDLNSIYITPPRTNLKQTEALAGEFCPRKVAGVVAWRWRLLCSRHSVGAWASTKKSAGMWSMPPMRSRTRPATWSASAPWNHPPRRGSEGTSDR